MNLWGCTVVRPSTGFVAFSVGAPPSGAGKEDRIRTVPHFFGRAGRITTMGCFPNGSSVGAAGFRWAIYSDNNGEPDTLLFDSGAITTWNDSGGGANNVWKILTANLDVEAMTIYHLVWKVNAAFVSGSYTFQRYDADQGPNLLGYWPANVVPPFSGSFQVSPSGLKINGWRVDHAFATAYPTTFPTGGSYQAMCQASADPGSYATTYPAFLFLFEPA